MSALIDDRTRGLAGEPSWIRSSVEACRHASNLNAHDWLQLMSSAGGYVLADVLPGEDTIIDAIYSLQDLFREININTPRTTIGYIPLYPSIFRYNPIDAGHDFSRCV